MSAAHHDYGNDILCWRRHAEQRRRMRGCFFWSTISLVRPFSAAAYYVCGSRGMGNQAATRCGTALTHHWATSDVFIPLQSTLPGCSPPDETSFFSFQDLLWLSPRARVTERGQCLHLCWVAVGALWAILMKEGLSLVGKTTFCSDKGLRPALLASTLAL